MSIVVAPTPNPNALKFSCGVPVGGPATYVAGAEPEEEFARKLLELPGVTSIFMTADFVTLSKSTETDWAAIQTDAVAILEEAFPA